MPTDELVHPFHVPAPAARIFAHLAEPESYVGLSPLIVAVRDVRRADDRVSYVSVERFTLGPLKYDNRLRVTMTFPLPGRRIVSDVRSPGRVHLVATVDLVPAGDGTDVTETVRVTYPCVLRPLVVGQARSVQRARAAELTRRMTAS